MALRGPMISSDGTRRLHHVTVDGIDKIRVEAAGPKGRWYHLIDANTVPEVARHVNLADLKET